MNVFRIITNDMELSILEVLIFFIDNSEWRINS